MTLNPIGHSVGQRLTLPSAVQGHERLHSSTYNRAGVFLFHDFLQKDLAQQRFLTGCMESAAPTESFSANLNPDRDIIGTEHPLQIQAFIYSKYITLLRSSGSIRAPRSLHSTMVERPP
jgi:hypothetical protein